MEPPSKKKEEDFSPDKNLLDVQSSQSDTKKLLAIFPRDIWGLILNNVDKLDDLYKIREALPVFRDALSEQRIRILFPPVLKVLLEQCALLERQKLAGVTDNNENADFQKWIEFPDFVPLRQICRSWKTAIDNLFQNMPYLYQFPSENMSLDGQIYQPLNKYYTTAFEFGSAEDFTKFRSHFGATHLTNKTNPFPNREIGIAPPAGFGGARELDSFYDELLDLLRQYGQHIWYLTIDTRTCVDVYGLLKVYNNLEQMLDLVPNIKILWILMRYSDLPDDAENQNLERYRRTSLSLRNLKFIDLYEVPLSMFMELKKAMPKLEQIGLNVNERNDIEAFFKDTLRHPIRKLRLLLRVQVKWDALFGQIEKLYGDTLEHLHLSLRRPKTYDFTLNGSVTLPKLKVLYLGVVSPVPLDFLLGVSGTLEKLDLRFEKVTKVQLDQVKTEEHVVKFYHYLKELHKSSIWRDFRKLQIVNVWESFEQERKPSWSGTRKDWEIKIKERQNKLNF